MRGRALVATTAARFNGQSNDVAMSASDAVGSCP